MAPQEEDKQLAKGVQDQLDKAIDEIKKRPELAKEDRPALGTLKEKLYSIGRAKTKVDVAHKKFRAACSKYELPVLDERQLTTSNKQVTEVKPEEVVRGKDLKRTTEPKTDSVKAASADEAPKESWVQNQHGGYDIFVSKGGRTDAVEDTTHVLTDNQRVQLKAEANVRKGAPPIEVISKIEREETGQKSPPPTPYRAQPPQQPDKENWVRKQGS